MHTHETIIDGKRWLNGVQACSCSKKVGSSYVVTCKIHQRGTHDYDCTEQADRLVRSEKTWYLTDEARTPVMNAIRSFEQTTVEFENGSHVPVQIPQANMQILLRRRDKESFDAVVKDQYNAKRPETYWLKNLPIGEIIRETASALRWCFGQEDNGQEELWDLLWRTPANLLSENPFYLAALAPDDELLRLQIRLFYNLADGEDCRKLEKALGYRILPPLGEEFDRDFAIPSEEIDDDLLRQSGYVILHRPYFSMRGYTHNLWRINPCKKSGVDAAKEDSEPVSFRDFLRLFESSDT